MVNCTTGSCTIHIHSFGDKDESGVRQISCIGITLQNYTNGTGKNIKRVSANISPDEAEYIFNQLQNGVQEFNFQQEKIFGTPDENGRSHVTKLRIIRAVTGSDGKPRRYPWYLEIANGTGEKVKKDNGGIFMKANSYQEQNKEYINLNDMDFYKLMVCNAWWTVFVKSSPKRKMELQHICLLV